MSDYPFDNLAVLLVDLLAVYRLARLAIGRDKITERWNERLYARLQASSHGWVRGSLGYLIGCPWCVSAYIAPLVIVARVAFPLTWAYVALALAMSAAAGFLSARE